MFKNWGFLLGEMWGVILLATLLGLFAGWLIWGGRRFGGPDSSEVVRLRADLDNCRDTCKEKDAAIGRLEARLSGTADLDFDRDGVIEGVNEGIKPVTLAAPRAGKADNLKKIKGVGPQLEQLCNRLGFWHFDQIATWTEDEVAWVDANLEGFKGRVTRDNWVEQAKVLAAGGQTEFSKRVDAGDVYDEDA